jgi:hypothetical protein
VLERTVRTVSELRARLNIDRFTLFSLRDVALQNESNQDDLFQFFGITTADYKRKPAFYTLKQLIAEFGATC